MNSNTFNSRQGSVLMVTVIIATIMAVAIGSFIRLANHENRQANISFYANNSLNLAEGGVERALYAINFEDWDGWTQSGGVAKLAPIETNLGNNQTGITNVRIRNLSGRPIVVAEGRILLPGRPDVTKQVEVHLVPRSLFDNGITTLLGTTFSGGNAWVDSYHSSLGPPSASNSNDNGSVASVSVTTDALSLSNSTIFGYVATGGSQPTVGPNGKIYGLNTPSGQNIDPDRVALDFSADFPEVEAPTTFHFSYANITSTTTLGTVGATEPTIYRVVSILLSGSSQLNIVSPVVLEVLGEVSVSGGAEIRVEAGASATFYVEGDMAIGGNGAVNVSEIPENLIIYGTNNVHQTFKLHGNGQLQAAVYAPNADVDLKGGGSSGSMAGSVVAKRATINGNYRFHYDEDLADFGDKSYRMNRWRELHLASNRVQF